MIPIQEAQQARKIWALGGWAGFTEQLRDGEDLLIRYVDRNGVQVVKILDTPQLFDKIVLKLRGQQILGFYAGTIATLPVSIKAKAEVAYDRIASTVHRPVEDLVLASIDANRSAVIYL